MKVLPEQLAREHMEVACEVAESPQAGRLARLTYTFQQIGVPTKLVNRIYPREEVEREVDRIGRLAVEGKLFGEIDHPEELLEVAQCKMAKAATIIQKVALENGKVVVVQDVLDNPYGRQLKSILDGGGKPGISQRAVVMKWRPATADEKRAHGLSETATATVAVGLRLSTYDNVTVAGIPQADFATAVEREAPMEITAAKLKAEYPAIYSEVYQEGVKSVNVTSIGTSAVESARPTIIEEATKPLKDRLASLEDRGTKMLAAVEGMATSLRNAGIITGALADADATTRITTAETRASAAEAKVKELQTKLDASESAGREAAVKAVKGEIIGKVTEAYKTNPDLDVILKATEACATVEGALMVAATEAQKCQVLRARAVPGTNPNPAAPTAPAGGGAGAPDARAANREYVSKLLV